MQKEDSKTNLIEISNSLPDGTVDAKQVLERSTPNKRRMAFTAFTGIRPTSIPLEMGEQPKRLSKGEATQNDFGRSLLSIQHSGQHHLLDSKAFIVAVKYYSFI